VLFRYLFQGIRNVKESESVNPGFWNCGWLIPKRFISPERCITMNTTHTRTQINPIPEEKPEKSQKKMMTPTPPLQTTILPTTFVAGAASHCEHLAWLDSIPKAALA
jgi:hypothetical protein